MNNILLYVIIAILFIIIIYQYFSAKKHLLSYFKKEKGILEMLHEREIEGLKQIDEKLQKTREDSLKEIDNIKKQLALEQSTLNNYKINRTAAIKNEVALYREEQLNKIKQDLISIDLLEKQKIASSVELVKKECDNQIKLYKDQVDKVLKELQILKEKRDSTLAIIKEEEKVKNEIDFYRLIIPKEDIEDIEQLRSIEKRLNNKDILQKLIYKTFIEVPMNLLFGRVGIKDEPGIYKITNIKNNMVYIGQSTSVKNRVKAHIQSAIGITSIASQIVHDAMSEEGLSNFTFQLVEECPKEQLSNREKYWINYYESNSYGYNRTAGGART